MRSSSRARTARPWAGSWFHSKCPAEPRRTLHAGSAKLPYRVGVPDNSAANLDDPPHTSGLTLNSCHADTPPDAAPPTPALPLHPYHPHTPIPLHPPPPPPPPPTPPTRTPASRCPRPHSQTVATSSTSTTPTRHCHQNGPSTSETSTHDRPPHKCDKMPSPANGCPSPPPVRTGCFYHPPNSTPSHRSARAIPRKFRATMMLPSSKTAPPRLAPHWRTSRTTTSNAQAPWPEPSSGRWDWSALARPLAAPKSSVSVPTVLPPVARKPSPVYEPLSRHGRSARRHCPRSPVSNRCFRSKTGARRLARRWDIHTARSTRARM